MVILNIYKAYLLNDGVIVSDDIFEGKNLLALF